MKQKFAKKSLGQNFLHSTQVRDAILEESGNIAEKNILEIGPGLGFLTAKLLQQKADLTVVELDMRASKILQKDFGHLEKFHLIEGDILKISLDEVFPKEPYAVIANIPYNITGPILRKLLEQTKNKPQFAILMVQKEVAKKICNSKKRSILSLAVEVFAKAKICFFVSREHFSPVPNVDSAIIRLDIRPTSLVEGVMQKDFFTVVRAGFSEKRKKLGNVLGKFFGVSSQQLLGDISSDKRAETLIPEEWIEITKRFQIFLKKTHLK